MIRVFANAKNNALCHGPCFVIQPGPGQGWVLQGCKSGPQGLHGVFSLLRANTPKQWSIFVSVQVPSVLSLVSP